MEKCKDCKWHDIDKFCCTHESYFYGSAHPENKACDKFKPKESEGKEND